MSEGALGLLMKNLGQLFLFSSKIVLFDFFFNMPLTFVSDVLLFLYATFCIPNHISE